MPKYTAAPRPRRWGSGFCSTCCCVLLVVGVIVVGLNLARILASEIDLQKVPKVTETPRPPNYYQQIGVSPLISEQDLRAVWRKYGLEHHPDKNPLTALTLEETEDYLQKSRIFETLLDGRLRCEYDEKHRIKGRWQAVTCREAFREEYREFLREEVEMVWEKQEAAAEAKSGGRKVKVEVKVEAEQHRPREVEVEKQQPLTTEPGMKASPQARPAVPVVTVELGPEPENRIPGVDSIPGFKALKSAGVDVWTNGLVYEWIQFKAHLAYGHEKVFSVLRHLANTYYYGDNGV